MLTKSRLKTRGCSDRFVEGLAALDPGGHVTDDAAQVFLAFRGELLVKRGQRLDERDAGLDHGGELAGEENQIGLFDRPGLVFGAGNSSFLLE